MRLFGEAVHVCKGQDLLEVLLGLGRPAAVGQVVSSDALDDEVVLGEGAGLVEAADVDLSGVGDAEGLGAEDRLLDHGDDGVVDGERELHGQLGRHHVGDDEHAAQHDLVPASVGVLQPLLHDVVAGEEGEDEEDEEVVVDLHALHGHSVGAEQDHSHQLALLRLEPVLEHNAAESVFYGRLLELRHVGVDVSGDVLQNLGAAV
mmetsp:Transcript_16379/g.27726  ORF Transcript_16379/g.27726 Transcript_16379/m.27726 type:complete len:204 (-) Transcript_16379:1063-1674(-)